MKPSSFRSYFTFTKSQRTGLFALGLLIVLFQGIYFFWESRPPVQQRVDQTFRRDTISVKADSFPSNRKQQQMHYPFNPNFITDFKGYQWGMSVAQIDRLFAFRKSNRFVNSAEEFQKVTGVSDSLLHKMAPYFKFPDWVTHPKSRPSYVRSAPFKKELKEIIDINEATADDLKKVYGIGDGLSERILKEKEKLGGFVSMDQMEDIWGLSPEVIEKLKEGFAVKTIPPVKKLKLNQATMKELLQFPYFKYQLAKAILTYRSMHGGIKDSEELAKISGFPVDKIKTIALYLDF